MLKSFATLYIIFHFAVSTGYAIQRSEIEAAIFSSNPRGNLRLLRNSIFARHGRTFTDAVLQEHFRKQPWYTQNPNYSDSLLTPNEKADALRIAKYENELQEITENDRRYLQHLRTVYAKFNDGRDSVRELTEDITGEGFREKMILKTFMNDTIPTLTHMVVRGTDTLYNNSQELSFSPEAYFDSLYELELFGFVYPYMNLEIGFGADYQVLPAGSYEATVLDSNATFLPGAKTIHVVTDESGGDCSKIWESKRKRFVNYYCN